MKQVRDHTLWIGHAGDGRDFRAILDAGIRAIVQLAIEEPPIQPPRELIFLRFPLLDGGGNDVAVLRLAIDAVLDLIEREIPTLVCCGAGMSRSPGIVAAALAHAYRSQPEQVLQVILQDRPSDVSPALWAEIQATLKSMPW